MRSLIITVILFFSICAIIIVNNLYIKNTAEYICECVSDDEFESDPEKAIKKLDEFWEKNHPIVGLSIGYKELDKMSDLIIDLKIYFELENAPETKRIRALIVEAANEISRLERFDLENLF